MKKMINLQSAAVFGFSLLLFSGMFFLGCNETDNSNPVYQQNISTTGIPEIVSVSPADSAFAGIDEITITGHNFSTDPTQLYVFFNTTKATVLSADTNKLVVKAPNLVADVIGIKVDKLKGSEAVSNSASYKLVSAVIAVKEFSTGNQPNMITLDNAGNVYYNSTLNSVSEGVMKITPDGIITQYAKKGGETFYSGLKFAKSDSLLGTRKVTALFKIPEGSAPSTYVSGFGKSVMDFDMDANGSIWAVSNQDQIYRVKPSNKDKKTFNASGLFRTCRVFNNYLYAAGQKSASDPSEIVWRFPIITADSISVADGEIFFDFSAAGYNGTVQAITFSQDGFLYVGNNGDEPIIIVNPVDKSNAPLYPGVLNPNKKNKLVTMFWGEGYFLYYVRQIVNPDDKTAPLPLSEAIVKVNTRKLGAPYLGNN